jgi:hypothetical protein
LIYNVLQTPAFVFCKASFLWLHGGLLPILKRFDTFMHDCGRKNVSPGASQLTSRAAKLTGTEMACQSTIAKKAVSFS